MLREVIDVGFDAGGELGLGVFPIGRVLQFPRSGPNFRPSLIRSDKMELYFNWILDNICQLYCRRLQ